MWSHRCVKKCSMSVGVKLPMVLPRNTTSFGMSRVMLVMASSKRASSPVKASSGNSSSAMRLDAMSAVALTSTGAKVPRPRARGQRLEQMDGLFRETGAELDDAFHRRKAHEGAGLALEDGRFRAGRVVLGQLADLLEQQRPPFVVEMTGFEPPGTVEQGLDHAGGGIVGGAPSGGQNRRSRDAPGGSVVGREDLYVFTGLCGSNGLCG